MNLIYEDRMLVIVTSLLKQKNCFIFFQDLTKQNFVFRLIFTQSIHTLLIQHILHVVKAFCINLKLGAIG